MKGLAHSKSMTDLREESNVTASNTSSLRRSRSYGNLTTTTPSCNDLLKLVSTLLQQDKVFSKSHFFCRVQIYWRRWAIQHDLSEPDWQILWKFQNQPDNKPRHGVFLKFILKVKDTYRGYRNCFWHWIEVSTRIIRVKYCLCLCLIDRKGKKALKQLRYPL